MPNEPDNNVEEQLKAWAAARRNEASGPFELHPAARKMLQDEVARTFTATRHGESEAAPGWLALLQPRLAFALSVVAAMIVISVAIWPSLSPDQTRGRQLLADRGEKEILERRQEASAKVEAQAAPRPVLASRTGNEVAPPALAVNAPAESLDAAVPLSRAYRSGEAAQTFDERLSVAKNSQESRLRADTTASTKPVLEEKAKEIALAKDGAKLSEQDASGVLGRRESAVEQFGLKPATGQGLAGVQTATVEKKTDEPALALRDSGAAAATRAKRPASVAAVSAASASNDKEALLSYQKSQAVAQLDAPATAGEADRSQASNGLGFLSLATGPVTQQFAQVVRYRRNFNSPPAPKVLTTFQLEQHGRQLRIIDADGSVYEGEFTPGIGSAAPSLLADEKSGDELKEANVPKQTSPGAVVTQGGQNAGFRVEGTNRTLNQPIVFTGNLWVPASVPAPAAPGDTPQRGAVLLQQPTASRGPAPQNLLRVQGQATIGIDRIEINAVPSGP